MSIFLLTGISFAALGAYYNHPVHIFIPNTASIERIKIMKLYGAKVYLVSKKDGGFKEAIKRADKLAELHKDDIDIMIKLLNGDIFNQAVEQISVEIKAGLYDEMLQPKEYNL